MALSANLNWRVTTAGAEANGGGFDPSLTTNMLTNGAATSATGASPVFSSASYTFVAGDVGAYLYIAAGTNWTPGWYPIASVAGGNATLDAAITSNRGGALKAASGLPLTATGCATTASPTGATFTIDYTPLATAVASASDLTSSASTTITSATGAWHKAMIGNTLKLTSGPGTTAGYYSIVDVASATSLTADRASGTYTVGVYKIGGAHASILNYGSAGTLSGPAVTSPLAAGHTVWIKGAGSENPGSADYNHNTGYWTWGAGSYATGRIYLRGYNGRPRIDTGPLLTYQLSLGVYMDLVLFQSGAATVTDGTAGQATSNVAINCVFDLSGHDNCVWFGGAINCYFKNSGATTAGTAYVHTTSGGIEGFAIGNVYENCRGGAISMAYGGEVLLNNIIRNCKGTSSMASVLVGGGLSIGSTIYGNTIDAGAGDGVRLVYADGRAGLRMMNNIISNHAGSGKYGINCTAGAVAYNDNLMMGRVDYNNVYGNTAGYNNCSAGRHDLALDPGYVDTASGDYSVGTNMKAVGFPATFPG